MTSGGEPHPDRHAIERAQLESLESMTAALAENRFYREKWRAAGVFPPFASLNDFRERCPFTTKAEIVEDQLAFPPFGTNLTYPLAEYTRFSQTSGTTSTPLRWLDTNASWAWMVGNWVQVLHACGIGAGDRLFFAFSFGPFLGFWTAFEAGARLGCLCLPGGGMSSRARLHAILENGVTVLCCTPTYAVRLAEVAAEEGVDLRRSRVRFIVVAGEPGAGIPATRARIEALWPGARLRDHHGMTEVGPVSLECPARERVLHILEREFIPEVIDPATGTASKPGEQGELVLTNLGRWGSPLIRYRTGDLVRRAPEAACACGRHDLALDGGILGRVDDMLVVRGVNVFPSAVEETVRAFAAVAEYRVEIRTHNALPELRLDVEPVPGCRDGDRLAREVESALRAALSLRVPVSLVAPGSLPRFELKARRWVRVEDECAGEEGGSRG